MPLDAHLDAARCPYSILWIDVSLSLLDLNSNNVLLNYDKIMRIVLGLFKGKSLNLK